MGVTRGGADSLAEEEPGDELPRPSLVSPVHTLPTLTLHIVSG